ncbi:DNA polymerase III subunit beta [Jiella marina]|uniref:DNA polymerase III subunit beta n=1 Tax=Jiella sp. LLJ827 TaxID=2917712 RepID=UPI00210128AE|nr:DNA polymerase III subunit beta [Jiella sp. LLJ827]MCQ0989504.1 DNA polymerase III subunit beta [Jiella sp. LLJ827]
MRIIIERSNLLKSLSHVHRVVERRNTIPILSNVLVRTEDEALRLKATDLDIEITESVKAAGEQPGGTTVPAHLLYDIVRKLPDGSEVKLATNGEGTQMTVSSGRSNFRLQCLPEADFPDITAGDLSHHFTMEAGQLLRLIERTQFAISTEETRYYLNGIYLHTVEADGDLTLRAVATDGHRLARAEMKAPSGSEGMPGIIVPRKTVGEVQKLLGDCDADDEITVDLSDSKIRFVIGNVVMTSKLIDGTFPDYQRVIPQNNDKALTLDRQSFSAAVDRVSTISSERGRAVKLSLSPAQLVLTVNSPDSGTATEELAVEYDSDEIEIGFNARYLLDITAQLSGESAVFMLADPGSPTLIRDGGDETTLYVLMPMRV